MNTTENEANEEQLKCSREIEVKNNKLQLNEQLNGLEYFSERKLEKIIVMYCGYFVLGTSLNLEKSKQ